MKFFDNMDYYRAPSSCNANKQKADFNKLKDKEGKLQDEQLGNWIASLGL